MKIYFSFFYQDYIFVIGGQPYIIDSLYGYTRYFPLNPNHLKNSRMHKPKKDKEVIFICTIKD